MPNDIPEGYRQITGGIVQAGDLIKAPDGWREATNVGPSLTTATGVMSAVGHPTSLYVCVVRAIG
jgi:hypothetical protein